MKSEREQLESRRGRGGGLAGVGGGGGRSDPQHVAWDFLQNIFILQPFF